MNIKPNVAVLSFGGQECFSFSSVLVVSVSGDWTIMNLAVRLYLRNAS